MYRLLAALRPVLALAALLVALDTGTLDRAGAWVVQEAQGRQPSCCVSVPSTTPGADRLVAHVQQLNAVTRWVASLGGMDLPS